MALKDDIALLATVPLFSDLTDEQLRLVAFGAERRSVPAGQTLCRQGTAADCAYVVAAGRFDRVHADHRGKAVKDGAAGRGTLFGEIALVSAVEWKLTAVAAEPSEVIRITRPLFRRMLEEYPEIADLMAGRIAGSLGRMVGELGGVAKRLGAD